MDIRFGTRNRAAHQPLNAINPATHLDTEPEPEPEVSPRNAGRLRMAVVFLAGLVSGIGLAWYEHTAEIDLIHGLARQGGLLHVDPIGNLYWDQRVNGARGTSGMREDR